MKGSTIRTLSNDELDIVTGGILEPWLAEPDGGSGLSPGIDGNNGILPGGCVRPGPFIDLGAIIDGFLDGSFDGWTGKITW